MDQPGLLVALAKLLNDSLLFQSMEFSEPPLNITLLVVVTMWQASPLDFLPFISCHSILPNIAVGLATSMSLLLFFSFTNYCHSQATQISWLWTFWWRWRKQQHVLLSDRYKSIVIDWYVITNLRK
jgi:hypothetical protein